MDGGAHCGHGALRESAPDAITSLWKDGDLYRPHLMAFTKDERRRPDRQALGGRVEGSVPI